MSDRPEPAEGLDPLAVVGLPAGLNVQRRDPDLALNYVVENGHAPLRHVASNSFGFGGSNACLVFGGEV